ncbi:SDR family oxidoreductase [Kitasatospora sp. HPMI-4]|uniref:SDR family oxidoreductase n=1 Tax=Kitasatospora sp. HPMI-4 TaxID=3448443 RepID=UPI003F1D08D3
MNGPTILLTGGSGVVGSALLQHLQHRDVVTLTHRKPLTGDTVRGDITRPWLGLDPTDYRALASRVDVIVHSAGSVDFGAAPDRLHDLNVRGTGHALHFAADAGARLLYVSSAFVARTDAFARIEQQSNGRTITLGAYARSKTTAETMVRESGLPTTIARLSTVIGDSVTGRIARLQAFHYLVGLAMNGMLPFLPAEPGTCADLIPQDTAAASLAALATSDTGTDTGADEHWITAGPAALPISRVIDIGLQVADERLRRDPTRTQMTAEVFKPLLVSPQASAAVIDMVLAQTGPQAQPSLISHLTGLMAAFNGADPFPTSLGAIPGGPPAPTETTAESALTAMCHHLAGLPKEIWNPSF